MDVRFHWFDNIKGVGYSEHYEIVDLDFLPRIGEMVEISYVERRVKDVVHVTNNKLYGVSGYTRVELEDAQ